jgi:hypothetical protein
MADSRNLDQRLQEQKILKEQVKRLGKKGKDEAAKLEAEMESRHAAELAALAGERKQTAAEIVAVADSLYTVHLSGEQDSEQQQKVTHMGFLVMVVVHHGFPPVHCVGNHSGLLRSCPPPRPWVVPLMS